jgi:hypothetical protein
MSAADVPLRYRRLRAPREDGAALIDPPVAAAAALVGANLKLATTWDRASGLPFSNWRAAARERLLRNVELIGHDASEQDVADLLRRPFILAGHQPSLFHSGVWLKDFLLDRIAKEVGGNGINLIVDNDTVRHAGIRVPTGTPQSPRVVDVPLDAPAPEMPWEERQILDMGVFREFNHRVHEAIEPLLGAPGDARGLLIDLVWPHARQFSRGIPDEARNLGTCLAHARHAVERSFGLATQEAPLSRLVGWLGGMNAFLDHLLSRWHELHPIYNAALREHRTINHIRSRKHPAPDLAAEGQWLEVPFWLWRHHDTQRKRAYVRCAGSSWELSDLGGLTIGPRTKLRLAGEKYPWGDGELKFGVKIRPRALITTMFARLILSDLFIHGIGGAKYDELTDVLIRRFFGIEPPAYVTATATFRLPIERPQVTEDDVRTIERRIRDIVHHPETFVDELSGNRESELKQLAAQKKELIAAGWNEKQKKAWHDRVAAGNDRMTALLDDVRQRLIQQREKLLSDFHSANLLNSREFSFVLFPQETLPRALLDLCAARP